MQVGLRPKVVALGRDKAAQHVFQIRRGQRAIVIRVVCGFTAARLVDDINAVSLPQKELSPAFTAIRGPREIRSRLSQSVNHDDRPRMRLSGRNLKLDVQLVRHHLPIVGGRIFSADEEVTLLRDRQRRGCALPGRRRKHQDRRRKQNSGRNSTLVHKFP